MYPHKDAISGITGEADIIEFPYERVEIDIEFDRPFNAAQHYLSVGSFTALVDGEVIQFDFEYEDIYCPDVTRPEIMHCIAKCLDRDAFPDAVELPLRIGRLEKLLEVFVYTGEHNDAEIKPVRLVNAAILMGGQDVLLDESELSKVHIGN